MELLPVNCPVEVLLCLYRVAQESVQNAARHSHARNAQIELKTEGKRLYLRISDDGVGFDPQDGMRSGLGLVSMRERIKAVGGTIRFNSTRESGTCIEASVPLFGSPAQETPPSQTDNQLPGRRTRKTCSSSEHCFPIAGTSSVQTYAPL